jgi:Tfp pilus assembly protein PilV
MSKVSECRRRAVRWRREPTLRCADRGLSIIEVVVAIALLALVTLPVTRIIVETGSAANQDRLRIEAVNIATNAMESLQNESYFGVLQTGSNTTTQTLAENTTGAHPLSDTFQVTTSLQPVAAGSDKSLCTESNGSQVGAEVWLASITVSWTGDGVPITQTTEIAPNQAGVVPQDAGEVVVPLEGPDFSTAYTASTVWITIIGTGTGSVPSNEVIAATANTGGTSGAADTGCVVFQNLDPNGYTYTVYLGSDTISNPRVAPPAPTNETGVVMYPLDPGLIDAGTPTTAVPTDGTTPISVTAGQLTVVAPLYLAGVGTSSQAATATSVADHTVLCTSLLGTDTCLPDPTVSPAADLPVTVDNTTFPTGQQVFSFDTDDAQPITAMQLFPGTSSAAPQTYTAWSGDTDDSSPTYQISGTSAYPGGPAPTSISAVQGVGASASLDVFPLILSDPSAPAGAVMTVTEVQAPKETYTLSAFTLGVASGGLPLGQYVLGAQSGDVVTSPPYIWVTPTAVYYGESTSQTNYTSYPSSKPAGTAITVTVTT